MTKNLDSKRQLLWQNSVELQDLRRKVWLASVAQDQVMQLDEKKCQQQLRKLEKVQQAEEIKLEREMMEKQMQMSAIETKRNQLLYHKYLDEFQENKKKFDCSKEKDIENEIAVIDKIRKQVEEENKERMKKHSEMQKNLHREAQELRDIREKIRQEEILRDSLQDIKINEYLHKQELRTKDQERIKHLNHLKKLTVQEKLLSDLENVNSEKLKQEVLRLELAAEEKDLKVKRKEQGLLDEKSRLREHLQEAYKIQMHSKEQKYDILKKENELYREQLLSDLNDAKNLELMSQEQRRLKVIENRRIVQDAIQKNHQKKENEKTKELEEQRVRQEMENNLSRMIKEEKIRFLKDNVPGLLRNGPRSFL